MNVKSSSLIWKMAIPVLLVFGMGIVFLMFYIPNSLRGAVVQNAVASSQQTVDQFKTLRKYYAGNVISKVLNSRDIRPAVNHRDNPNAVPLPATMIHDLSNLMDEKGTRLKLYSPFPFPNRATRQLDDFQAEAWKRVNANPKQPYVREVTENGKSVVRVAVADHMVSQVCVGCHNSHPDTPRNDWKLDDVRGVLEVDMVIDEQVLAGQATSWVILGVLVLVLLLILMTIGFVYNRLIGQRLAVLNHAMNDIAEGEGDLTRTLDASGNDELSLIATSFNQFVEKLRHSISEVSRTSHELREGAEKVASTTQNSSHKIRNQYDETAQVATAINQMSTCVNEVASGASNAEMAARQAEEAVAVGRNVVDGTVASINTLGTEVEQASTTIGELEANAENIGSVLDVIRGIAEQTNLLALNAAIEAARAGEQGRGFAVVADEVRMLATRTQQSTEEIQSMIENLQVGARRAVEVMNKGKNQAVLTMEQAEETNLALQTITNAITTITDLNTQIASASEQQGAVSDEIARNITAISSLADEVSSSAEESAHAGSNLAGVAENLDQIVKRFRV